MRLNWRLFQGEPGIITPKGLTRRQVWMLGDASNPLAMVYNLDWWVLREGVVIRQGLKSNEEDAKNACESCLRETRTKKLGIR